MSGLFLYRKVGHMNDTFTILIVDSHPSVRSGLRALLKTAPDMEVIGDTHDCETAVNMAYMFHPDIIILDMMAPRRNGIGIMRAVRRASPESKILVLTDNDNTDQVLNAINEGARGYLLKDPLSADIASAIRDVLDGKLIVHYRAAQMLKDEHLADEMLMNPEYKATPIPDLDFSPNASYSSSSVAMPCRKA